MKKILKQLDEIRTSLQETLDNRGNIFDERSEKWQESENGSLYLEKNDSLDEIIEDLSMVIKEVDRYMEN